MSAFTSGMPADLDHVLRWCMRGVKLVSADLEPQEDWRPVALIFASQRIREPAVVTFEAPSDRDLGIVLDHFTQIAMPAALRDHADRNGAFGFIYTAWAVLAPNDGERSAARVADDPAREECVVIHAVSAFEHRVVRAAVTRHADAPPTVGDFREITGHVSSEFGSLQDVFALAFEGSP